MFISVCSRQIKSTSTIESRLKLGLILYNLAVLPWSPSVEYVIQIQVYREVPGERAGRMPRAWPAQETRSAAHLSVCPPHGAALSHEISVRLG